MVHRGSHLPCEWFAGEVTSAAKGSQGKSLPLLTIHRGSDIFDLKIHIIAGKRILKKNYILTVS